LGEEAHRVTLAPLDWIVITCYIILVLVIGLAYTRRAQRGTEEYFLSGRQLPWWIAGTSMVATSFSVDTPLLITGWTRTGGIQMNWIWWGLGISGMFSVFALSRLWRRASVVTDVELTELRYSGKSAQWLRGFRGFWLAVPVNTIAMAMVLRGMGKVAKAVTGLPEEITLPVAGGVVFICTYAAGLWGVVITDFIEYFVAQGSAIVFAIVAVHHIGGLSSLIKSVSADKLTFFAHPPTHTSIWESGFWTPAVVGLAVYAFVQWWAYLNSDGGGKIIQRLSASKDERHALWGLLWFNISHYAIRTWPWILCALVSLVVYPQIADPEMAYPKLMMEIMPVGWLGLMIAGFLAAFMSTINTQLNWGSSYVINDIYRRFIKKEAGDHHYMVASRISVLILSALTVVVALSLNSIRDAFMFILAFGAGTGAVYILRWFWWRINAWTEISAMIASTVISTVLYLLNKYSNAGISHPAIITLTALGSAVVWLLVTWLTPPVSKVHLETFYRRTHPWGAWGPVKDSLISSAGIQHAKPRLQSEGTKVILWSVSGTIGLFSIMFGIGKLLLGSPLLGLILIIIALLSCVYLIRSGAFLGGKRLVESH
jgi:SSS family solute:Na+ symporter